MTATVRVKVCGLVRDDDVREAVRAGADYLGFILATESPRTLTPDHVAALRARVETGGARTVGVFRDQPATWINDVIRICGLDYAQLHGHEPRDFAAALAVPVIRVVRVPAGDAAAAQAATATSSGAAGGMGPTSHSAAAAPAHEARDAGLPLAPNVFAALVDTEDTSGRSGGLGRRADPAAVAACIAALPAGTRVFVSGGLTPENVADAVRLHRPFAVDVSSGVESAPGAKDPSRLVAFVTAAKGAR
jgi:phosphoribosylanthranilate isomerase